MKFIMIFLMLIFMVLVNSCTTSMVSPVKWYPEEEGIVLHVYADKMLNGESGITKPIDVIVYQLKNKTSFIKRVNNKKELYSMLECKKFDLSVASVKKIKVLPGSYVTYNLDRFEGANHVAVISGYDYMDKKKATRLYEVPVFIIKETLFSSKSKLVPGRLEIKIRLSADGIEEKEVPHLKRFKGNSH